MHTQGYFALEPVGLGLDRKKLTLCFWWLKQGQLVEEVSVSGIPDLTGTYDPQGDCLGLLNMHTYHPLCSGDIIVLITPDPNTHPLARYQNSRDAVGDELNYSDAGCC